MSEIIKLEPGVAGFAEDKDQARLLRISKILPTLDRGDSVVLDFSEIRYATQSYVHALIGETLRKYGEPVLERLEFKNCSPQLRSLIELVVDYSLGGFSEAKAL
ncbi:MAG TPA: STAS-like domain-containing protein [Thermoanaerobaculia bacterium]|jgi:hypothetical protein|nr:STAS-like domain-containing protein [Thermoanaerobaculia bacterium]